MRGIKRVFILSLIIVLAFFQIPFVLYSIGGIKNYYFRFTLIMFYFVITIYLLLKYI